MSFSNVLRSVQGSKFDDALFNLEGTARAVPGDKALLTAQKDAVPARPESRRA